MQAPIPNPSPTEILNILVQAGFTGFMVFLVVLLIILVWKFGTVFAKSLG